MSLIQLPTFKMRPDEQIVPLQFNHLLSLELGPHEKEYARHIPGYLDYVFENSEQGWSWAAIGRGKVICVFGVRDWWPGVVEAWFLPGEGLENHARSTLVGARALLGEIISQSGVRRMQIFVKCDHMVALKFAKALYFEVESTHRKFGPEGADYYSMVRFE